MQHLSGRVFAALAVVLLVVAGAAALRLQVADGDGSANGSRAVGSVEDLAGRWVAVNTVGAPAPVVPGTLSFSVDGDRLAVQPGCNSGGGRVAVDGSRLVVPDGLAVTEMACLDADRMAQEQWALEMLAARPRLERSGPYLFLHWGPDDRWWIGLEQQPAST
ncbi:META domain-containing protein [Arthrobacter sp. NEB 688]|uniref:META domain-containing protein n=1 Tax=Arthrobacter sp. NEB 688 TaxID=904039 RepID=UPI001563276F|nr:META domain-containing protein [Arthrobacter sp. NEB 688]QKE83034.1 META domain-containing protein [Arthrobacter sp. NEB 688]